MSKPVAHAQVATYRDLIGIGEGLSFSDIYDDSVPNEVKPPQMLRPMEEMDFPIKPNNEPLKPSASYWLSPDAKLYLAKSKDGFGHYHFAKMYIKHRNWKLEKDDDIYDIMYNNGWIKIEPATAVSRFLILNYNKHRPPSNLQIRELKNLAIETGVGLWDMNKIPHEMELTESDFPIQAKDLFKRVKEDVLKHRGDYWMDPTGRFRHCDKGHAYWGMTYLLQMGIPFQEHQDETIYDALAERGFIRVKILNGELYVDYDRGYRPTNEQWKNLKDSAIENHLKLIDGSYGRRREIDLLESVSENSDIFITGMKPEQKEEFKSSLAKLFSYLREELKLKTVPNVHLLEDKTNAKKLLGKTGYYDYTTTKICLYMTDRHPKDILRSFAHEVIHHWQHENKQLEKSDASEGANKDPQYAQNDPWMRQMEKQAYLLGNMMFRDWEDGKKTEDRKSNKKLSEKTLPIGKGYPPKKPNYRG